MAEKYGMLPTEIMDKATTFDLRVFYNANIIRDRQSKMNRGEDITNTYSKSSLEEMYYATKEEHSKKWHTK